MFGFSKNNESVVNVNDMDNLLGKVELIDVREPYEYEGGSLKSAINIPMGKLLNEPDKYLKRDEKYYIMCQSGGRSSKTCSSLTKQGFDVVNVAGGMGAYLGNMRK